MSERAWSKNSGWVDGWMAIALPCWIGIELETSWQTLVISFEKICLAKWEKSESICFYQLKKVCNRLEAIFLPIDQVLDSLHPFILWTFYQPSKALSVHSTDRNFVPGKSDWNWPIRRRIYFCHSPTLNKTYPLSFPHFAACMHAPTYLRSRTDRPWDSP